MTAISGPMVRNLSADTFADITPAPYSYSRDNGVPTLTFAADLTDQEQAAIWARATTRNDEELTNRETATAALAAACAVGADLDDLKAAVCALARLMGIEG